ncbi:N,N-dimethylformamidase beta subunit family domain-containing protein [Pontixanthobacter sp. CEM42]|uniref:N,N-dimethylformamidase beta subunit family domain-containing protein n=1 Tax=Pontixanthobacter sp. CEM42 TaxID=2792077 RepID=UPI001ADFCCB0|nr:N,N-dimethylformamidase beta subunit family domain-containing protein [Pontixanthobacter sp. CEM42]
MTVDRPWFYPDCVSATGGDTIRLFASAPASLCTLVVSRVGKDTVEVARFEGIAIGNHPIPDNADTAGCGWPECFSFTVAEEWQTGYHDLTLTDAEGRSSQHFLCVRKSKGEVKAKAVLILSTNTYTAYNYWGGCNAYADVMALVEGRVTPDASRDGAIAHLSRMRPYPQGLIAPPGEPPRLINYEPRDVGQMPIPGDLGWAMQHRPTPYDGSACFLKKWEHVFAIWAEEHGYELDYLTDHDFERDPEALSGYETALVVGHSEYWSGVQRFAVEEFTKAGGNFVSFSGNTCYWKVRWEDNGTTLVAHKWAGEENDPLWADPATRQEATHLWSHPEFSAPEARFLGLSFLYGGYHRIGMCAARGSAAYTIYDDEHWALKDTDLYYGDVIGGNVPLIGYENDGCPIQFGEDGLPKAGGGLGVPENLEIIATTPATLAESDRSPFPKIIPLEDREILTRVTFGEDSETNRGKLMRGHAVMASFKCGKGEVFNAGTTEWVHGLSAKDPFVNKITQNVLNKFGVQCNDQERNSL